MFVTTVLSFFWKITEEDEFASTWPVGFVAGKRGCKLQSDQAPRGTLHIVDIKEVSSSYPTGQEGSHTGQQNISQICQEKSPWGAKSPCR